jgi:nucleoside-diphosphate-sugar epimerase
MDNLVNSILFENENLCELLNFNELNNKIIILTGASGLLGVHFLGTIRNLNSNYNFNIKTIAITRNKQDGFFSELANFKGVTILTGDITDNNILQSLPNADYIIHAAGYGQPGKFMEDGVKTIMLNTYSTFELFTKLNLGGKFLFLSTSELYSGLEKSPFSETQIGTTNTDHPRSCYIEGKRCGEAIVNAYRNMGVDAKSARLSLAYGPGTQKGDKRVLNSFIEKALNGKIDMMDDGSAMRTYCYISDAIRMLWHILLEGKEAIYNVGGTSKVSILELAQMIAQFTNVNVTLPNSSQGISGAPNNVYLDMSKTENEFKINQYTPLDIGLKKTILWQKDLYLL